MAPRPGHDMYRDALACRRARIVKLADLGLSARQIGQRIGLSARQVQRHQRDHRAGRTPGKPVRS